MEKNESLYSTSVFNSYQIIMPINHIKSLQDKTGIWCADSDLEK